MTPGGSGSVLVAGLGDLGTRLVDILAREPRIERLVGAGRDRERGAARMGQARLIAELAGGPGEVAFEPMDLDDVEASAATIRRVAPDVIVAAASGHTWWRDLEHAPALAVLPYAAWLPLQVTPVRRLMEARREAGAASPVVCLPLPDVVGPVLAGAGLAPELGAGNVAEVAAKLTTATRAATGAARDEVRVSLVLHHAAERLAFSAFDGLSGGAPQNGEPPWLAEVLVRGEALSPDRVDALVRAPHPLPGGRASQQLTAAAAAAAVLALLADDPVRLHAPAPGGRPGGYPVRVSRAAVSLDLPDAIGEAEALEVNRRAAAWDGIEAIEADGTVVFSGRVADALGRATGTRVERLALADQAALAGALRALAAG